MIRTSLIILNNSTASFDNNSYTYHVLSQEVILFCKVEDIIYYVSKIYFLKQVFNTRIQKVVNCMFS
jgi:hypothetical protein